MLVKNFIEQCEELMARDNEYELAPVAGYFDNYDVNLYLQEIKFNLTSVELVRYNVYSLDKNKRLTLKEVCDKLKTCLNKELLISSTKFNKFKMKVIKIDNGINYETNEKTIRLIGKE